MAAVRFASTNTTRPCAGWMASVTPSFRQADRMAGCAFPPGSIADQGKSGHISLGTRFGSPPRPWTSRHSSRERQEASLGDALSRLVRIYANHYRFTKQTGPLRARLNMSTATGPKSKREALNIG